MVLSISTKNKSQVWSLDFIVAVVIFLSALIIFYKYSINTIDLEKQDINNLLMDAKLISSYLVSSGYPENWTTDNVTLIGLTDGEMRISEEKVEQFSSIASSDYTRSRRLLSTTNYYYISFKDKEGNPMEIGGIASIGKDYTVENPENLIKIDRSVFYDSNMIKIVVYVW